MWARFKSEEHKQAYNELLALAGAHPDNQEWSAALYALAATGKPVQSIARYFVDAFEGIDWDGLLKLAGPWSSGERCLVELAAALHSRDPRYRITLYDLGDLDEANFEVAILAIRRLNGRSAGVPEILSA